MSIRRKQPAFTDDFSSRWASLVQRSKKTKLFQRRAEHLDLLAQFEALIEDRKQKDDLPYAALVSLSLARYLESCAEQKAPQVAAYVEASECFWAAAHQDHEHGCTDPVEVLRLQARDAQAKALQFCDKWMQSSIFLRASTHLCTLEEYEEAAYWAERCAEIESASLDNAFDAYVARGEAAKCYALDGQWTRVQRTLQLMRTTAEKADGDFEWEGFQKGAATEGWTSSWVEDALLHVNVALLLVAVIQGRNEEMKRGLSLCQQLIEVRNGQAGEAGNSLAWIVAKKQADSAPSEQADLKARASLSLVLHEEFALVLLEAALKSVTLEPNWNFVKK